MLLVLAGLQAMDYEEVIKQRAMLDECAVVLGRGGGDEEKTLSLLFPIPRTTARSSNMALRITNLKLYYCLRFKPPLQAG